MIQNSPTAKRAGCGKIPDHSPSPASWAASKAFFFWSQLWSNMVATAPSKDSNKQNKKQKTTTTKTKQYKKQKQKENQNLHLLK